MANAAPTNAAPTNATRTLLITHPACAGHHIAHHPEQPKRVVAIEAAVVAAYGDNKDLARDACPADAPRDALLRFHSERHVARLEGLFDRVEADARAPPFDPARTKKRRPMLSIDDDTAVMAKSRAAALASCGGAMRAVDAVLRDGYGNAFACVRPPGHHATPTQAMGFCLFNNVGVAALHARETYGVRRVAVVDVDVHHGNGTEAYFRDDAELFYASFHQGGGDFYPGTGLTRGSAKVVNGARVAGETGVARNVVNCPLAKGAGLRGVRRCLADKILPALATFDPGLVILSLGFDALAKDPIGGLDLAPGITRRSRGSSRRGAGRSVSVLEGGYGVREIRARPSPTCRPPGPRADAPPPAAAAAAPRASAISDDLGQAGQASAAPRATTATTRPQGPRRRRRPRRRPAAKPGALARAFAFLKKT
ncbi:NAD-dependent histone deacetylase [Aureococcus anophagefferens]|nr:NAD-dependent histone deacetylase [Aureococcus anophagefferens]